MNDESNSFSELHPSAMWPTPLGDGDVVAEALRWYSRDPRPGAQVVATTVGPVLMAISTSHIYVWIDGVRLVHVDRHRWTNRWGQPLQVRPASGVLVTALHLKQGMLVRAGWDHYIVVDGDLVPVDLRVYRHLLRQRLAS